MKIAVATNTGDIVGQHFGRVKYYRVFTVEDGQIVADEMREKFRVHGTHHHHEHHHGERTEGAGHGFGKAAHQHHLSMVESIKDCDVLIAGMMGAGAYESFQSIGLKVILTDEKSVEKAVQLFLEGNLKNLIEERLH